ncbi:hypothetical protein [Micromonospora echinospora]|uniref:hypothetical protein n=1 Tax=Micromonospora echinospora TaxID=1877 RepID=UPI0012FDE7DF|nr:hypothetical protein [Micromonospora echinospora]
MNALYALARRHVRLSHLCVAPAWCGSARLFVEHISERHHLRLGNPAFNNQYLASGGPR